MKAMNVNMERPMDNRSAGQQPRIDPASTNGPAQQSKRHAPDQVGSNAMPTPHTHTRGTPAQFDPAAQPTNTLMVPSDVADGSYPVEPGAEYFGDFAFDGMDDILFGFNASESIFQDFM